VTITCPLIGVQASSLFSFIKNHTACPKKLKKSVFTNLLFFNFLFLNLLIINHLFLNLLIINHLFFNYLTINNFKVWILALPILLYLFNFIY
jgi:hypothetical protein